MLGIKPTIIVTEEHPLACNKVNPIVTLSISIYIFLLIALLFLLIFISPNLLVTALGTCLVYSTFTLALIRLDGLLLVFRNLLMIFLVRETTVAMVRWITIKKRIKTYVKKIECT